MTLDEAIRHAEKIAKEQMQRIDNLSDIPMFGGSDEDIKLIEKCEECASQHRQLAEWLRDYKRLLDVADSNVGEIYECTCGYGWYKNKVSRFHFCPNCGAKMIEP